MEKFNKTEDTKSNESDSMTSPLNSELNTFMQKYELLEKLG